MGSGRWGGESGVRRDGGCADIMLDQLSILQVRIESCSAFRLVRDALISEKMGWWGWNWIR